MVYDLKKEADSRFPKDIGLGPTLIPPIIQVIMVDNLVFIVMVITEVGIGLTPNNFMHITMAD